MIFLINVDTPYIYYRNIYINTICNFTCTYFHIYLTPLCVGKFNQDNLSGAGLHEQTCWWKGRRCGQHGFHGRYDLLRVFNGDLKKASFLEKRQVGGATSFLSLKDQKVETSSCRKPWQLCKIRDQAPTVFFYPKITKFEENVHRRSVEVLVVACNIRRKKEKSTTNSTPNAIIYSTMFQPVSAFVKSHCEAAAGVVDTDEEQAHTCSLRCVPERTGASHKRLSEYDQSRVKVQVIHGC